MPAKKASCRFLRPAPPRRSRWVARFSTARRPAELAWGAMEQTARAPLSAGTRRAGNGYGATAVSRESSGSSSMGSSSQRNTGAPCLRSAAAGSPARRSMRSRPMCGQSGIRANSGGPLSGARTPPRRTRQLHCDGPIRTPSCVEWSTLVDREFSRARDREIEEDEAIDDGEFALVDQRQRPLPRMPRK